MKTAIDIPAILLAGGMGTRLRSVVPSTPKALATVGQGSFLELILRQLQRQGIRRVIVCTGHLAEQIENKFQDGQGWQLAIEYSREQRPLGTAGAIKHAEQHLAHDADFLVMNGDSFVEMNFSDFLRFHHKHGGAASMALVKVENSARYGTVRVNSDNRVVDFIEKTGVERPGVVNAGVYLFQRSVLNHIELRPGSLEKETFPRLLSHGVYAMEQHGMFIDIGTPEDYARADALYDRLLQAAEPR